MSKIIIALLLLLTLNLSASFLDEGFIEYEKGNKLEASKLYKKACDNENYNACVRLGILYFTGDGVKENHKKAKKLFRKSCKKRYSQACYHLGTLYKRGGNGVKINYKKARVYYGAACKMGLIKSCDQYNLIREKREIVGSGSKNNDNFSYTYTTEIYGG